NIKRQVLDARPFVPEIQKRNERLALLDREAARLDDIIRKLKEKRDLEPDRAAKESISQQITSYETDRRGLGGSMAVERGKGDPSSFGDQFATSITDLQNQWATAASQMA